MTSIRLRHLPILVLAFGLGLGLTACSRHTALTVKADLVAFLNAGEKHTNVTYPAGSIDVQLPVSDTEPNPGELVDLTQYGVPSDAAGDIDAFALDAAATVTPTTDVDAGTVSLYLSPSDQSPFQSTYLIKQVDTPPMPANQATSVAASVQVDAQSAASALDYIRTGSFRLGAEIRATSSSAGSADVTLTRLLISVSLPQGWGLP